MSFKRTTPAVRPCEQRPVFESVRRYENDAARLDMVNSGAVAALAAICVEGAERTRVHAAALLKNLNSEPAPARANQTFAVPSRCSFSFVRSVGAGRAPEHLGEILAKFEAGPPSGRVYARRPACLRAVAAEFQLMADATKAEVDAAVDSLLASKAAKRDATPCAVPDRRGRDIPEFRQNVDSMLRSTPGSDAAHKRNLMAPRRFGYDTGDAAVARDRDARRRRLRRVRRSRRFFLSPGGRGLWRPIRRRAPPRARPRRRSGRVILCTHSNLAFRLPQRGGRSGRAPAPFPISFVSFALSTRADPRRGRTRSHPGAACYLTRPSGQEAPARGVIRAG